MLPYLILTTACSAVFLADNDPIYDQYMTLDEIQAELENLAENEAALDYTFELIKSDYTTEKGNKIHFVAISDQEDVHDWIVVVCGLDGSDWAAVTSCMNLIKNPAYYGFPHQLQNDQETPPLGFLSSVNLLIVPVANPDGYQYTFTDDRNWQKNRAPTSGLCSGVSLEHNFNYQWCDDNGGACNTNPCSDEYSGASADSEKEILAIIEELSNRVKYETIKTWVTVNQKGNLNGNNIAHSSLLDRTNRQSLDRHEIFLAEKFANAMSRSSGDAKFTYTSGPMDGQEVSGSSMEWAKNILAAEYSYEISIANGPLVPEADLRSVSTALLSALEIIWKNGDKRAVFIPTALDEYVWREDNTYEWYVMEELTIEDDYTTTYVLNMTSLTWLDESIHDKPVWWHYTVVVVPKQIQVADSAMLLIVGWNNKASNNPADVLSRSDTKRAIAYASHSGVTTVLNYCTPNQPIAFKNDPLIALYPNGRTEDGIIARTWHMFINNPTKPDVLLRLPMTKAAIRAMDTAEDFLVGLGETKPVRWGCTGASKRGWTTWTAAAVDYERIIFASPVWLDNLKLIPSAHHHYRSLGGWTFNYYDYYVEGFTLDMDRNPGYQMLADIVDPYTYLERYSRSQTLLIQHAGNDEFFLPSDTYFYWDELFGEKYMRTYPNKGHGGVGWRELEPPEIDNIVWQAIDGIFDEVLNPQVLKKSIGYEPWTWKLIEGDSWSAIEFYSNVKPTSVKAWGSISETSDRRDWRKSGLREYLCPPFQDIDINDKFDELWHYQDVPYVDISDQIEYMGATDDFYLHTYKITITNPTDGYIAYFLDIALESDGSENGEHGNIYFSTQSQVAPNTYSYDKCEGAACLGCFI